MFFFLFKLFVLIGIASVKLHIAADIMSENMVEALLHVSSLLDIEATITYIVGNDALQLFWSAKTAP